MHSAPRNKRRRRPRAAALAAAAALAGALGCDDHATAPRRPAPADASVVIVPRTPELATYPCMLQCHTETPANPTRRALREFHVGKEVRHGATITWCTFCHDASNYDRLRLIDGTGLGFNDAARLCSQCHAERHRDWERGIHGLQTGSWRDVGQRRSCAACHDPHDPRRPTYEALPPVREHSAPLQGGGHR